MKTYIYDVKREYTEYLQEQETQHRGFTTVPNMNYENEGRFKKFFIGPLFKMNGINYYVGASHKARNFNDNFNIQFRGEPGVVKGTLRFQYMIPVGPSSLEFREINKEENPSRIVFLEKYSKAVRESSQDIYDMALRSYYSQVNGELNSWVSSKYNDFKFLESKMVQYEINYRLDSLYKKNEVIVNYDHDKCEHYIDYGDYARYLSIDDLEDYDVLTCLVKEDLEILKEAMDYTVNDSVDLNKGLLNGMED